MHMLCQLAAYIVVHRNSSSAKKGLWSHACWFMVYEKMVYTCAGGGTQTLAGHPATSNDKLQEGNLMQANDP